MVDQDDTPSLQLSLCLLIDKNGVEYAGGATSLGLRRMYFIEDMIQYKKMKNMDISTFQISNINLDGLSGNSS